MLTLPKLIHRVNDKIPRVLYRQDYSKIHIERQNPRRAKTILKKKRSVGISLSGFKTYFIVTAIKTVQYLWKKRHINQWNRIGPRY